MDKNIVAFIREGAFTVQVRFQNSNGGISESGPYTYLSMDKSIQKGDYIIVPYESIHAGVR